MQVVINASYQAVPVLLAPFRGRMSRANTEAVMAAFPESFEKVMAEALVQQDRKDIFARERIGDAIVSTENGKTMVSRVINENAERRVEVADAKEATALVREVHGCDVGLCEGGTRTRLTTEGRLITCGTQNPFTPEQLAASVPVLYTVTTNRGRILAKII
ncbi:MAG: hypothetical protein ACRECD_01045 [Burkholderiaceae bacterium]